MKNFIKMGSAIVLMLVVSSVSAVMPKHVYACHVITVDNEHGIVMIQANSTEEAELASLKRNAVTKAATKNAISSTILQCVAFPEGQLSDYNAQQILKGMAF